MLVMEQPQITHTSRQSLVDEIALLEAKAQAEQDFAVVALSDEAESLGSCRCTVSNRAGATSRIR